MTVLTLLTALCSLPVLGQEQKREVAKELGWDLTYESILKTNQVGPDDFLSKWLKGTDRSFTRRFLDRWPKEKISASILIECPSFHAGEHLVYWLVRTKDKAFLWTAVDKGEDNTETRRIDEKLFDSTFKSISSWKQAKPNGPDEPFFGLLNVYQENGTRQMLLTVEDFYLLQDGRKEGRLQTILEELMKR